MQVPHQEQPDLMARIIARAQLADQHRKAYRRPHPDFGTGTLMSASSDYAKAPRPLALETEELDALATAINVLVAERKHQSA